MLKFRTHKRFDTKTPKLNQLGQWVEISSRISTYDCKTTISHRDVCAEQCQCLYFGSWIVCRFFSSSLCWSSSTYSSQWVSNNCLKHFYISRINFGWCWIWKRKRSSCFLFPLKSFFLLLRCQHFFHTPDTNIGGMNIYRISRRMMNGFIRVHHSIRNPAHNQIFCILSNKSPTDTSPKCFFRHTKKNKNFHIVYIFVRKGTLQGELPLRMPTIRRMKKGCSLKTLREVSRQRHQWRRPSQSSPQ